MMLPLSKLTNFTTITSGTDLLILSRKGMS